MTVFDNLPFYGGTKDAMIGLDVEIAKKIAKMIDVPVEFRTMKAAVSCTNDTVTL